MADTLQKLTTDEIIKPIDGDNPAGSDPEMNPDYINLDAELAKMSGIDYGVVSELTQKILSGESKHLRCASWLTLAWLKLEGVSGFRDGLAVIKGLLENFSGDLFPDREKMQIKSLEVLSKDKRILNLIKKAEVNDASALSEAEELMTEIKSLAEKQFKETPPDFSDIVEAIGEKMKDAGSPVPADADTESESAGSDDEKDQKPKSGKAEKEKDEAEESSDEKTEESKDGQAEAKDEDDSSADEEEEDSEIPLEEEVEDLLKPISDDEPTGEDVEKTDDQEVMVEYMALESEMGKFSGNDYEKCVTMCRNMLIDRTKHLRIAIWLLIAWSRVENLRGYKKGYQLLYHLTREFGKDLHPQKESQQINTYQMLSSEARIKLIEKIDVEQGNAKLFMEVKELFDSMNALVEEMYGDDGPRLTSVASMLSEKAKEADNLLNKEKQQQQRAQQRKQAATAERQSARSTSSGGGGTGTTSPVSSSAAVSARDIEFSTDRDADLALKKSLEFYFEESNGDKKNRKVAQQASIYGMSRLYRWGDIQSPPAKDNVTQIDPPNEPKQNFIQKLVSGKEYDKLIPEIEVNFLNRADFLYWLDAQKYVVEALEANGEKTAEAAEEVKVQLARLIKRLPDLPKLMYKDKKTPFASQETRKWLDDEVSGVLGSGKAKEKILPPILGEEYQAINEKYDEAVEELPDNFEKNL